MGKAITRSIEFAKQWAMQWPTIVQAPMAGGVTTPELVAAVCKAGGLGSYATGYLSTDVVADSLKRIKELTELPYYVNVFVPEAKSETMDAHQLNAFLSKLNDYRLELGLDALNPEDLPKAPQDNFDEMIELLLAAKVPSVSFTFGNLPSDVIKDFHRVGTYLTGTANTLEEALILQESGIDAVVAQGYEAGGHQGGFLTPFYRAQSTETLLSVMIKNLSIPVIAAGGIMNASDIAKALSQGAAAVQMGTAFLCTHESRLAESSKSALSAVKGSSDSVTAVTKAYSGKLARGLSNRYMQEMMGVETLPPYPQAHYLTTSTRKEAAKQAHADLMAVWCGEGVSDIRTDLSASELLADLFKGTQQFMEESQTPDF